LISETNSANGATSYISEVQRANRAGALQNKDMRAQNEDEGIIENNLSSASAFCYAHPDG
jgi:hypothetical protein